MYGNIISWEIPNFFQYFAKFVLSLFFTMQQQTDAKSLS